MNTAELINRHPWILAGSYHSAARLSQLPVAWLPLLDSALVKIEALLSLDDLASLSVEVGEKYNTLRIEANLGDLKHPMFRELQSAIDAICVEAEDKSAL